jgi:type I restriction enzyme S subunit
MIPEGWSEARLGDLGYIFGGLTGKSGKDFGTGSATFVTFMNVMANVVLSADGVEAVNVEPGEAQNQLRAGDVIFNGSSETPEEVGFGATVPETLEGVYLNSFCFGFRCYPDAALDATFLSYLTRSPVGREVIRPMAQGSTRYNLAKTNLLNGLFPIPPLAEQQAIAEALSDADALVESLDALIAKKRDMKQAAMQQLLTGRTRLLGESTEWEFVKVGEIARTLKGRGLSRDAVLETGAHPCLLYGELFTTYKPVARGVGGRTNSLDGEPSMFGDVLIPGSTTTSGEDLATATALLMDGVRLGGDVNIIRPDLQRIDPRWMAYVFTHCHRQDVALRAQGVTIHHLYGRDIASIEMRLPERDEQTRLADVLEDMDAEIDALVAQREKAELVKQGMMQELLSGRVRLV